MRVELADFRTTNPEPLDLIVTDPPYNIGHDYGPVSDRLTEIQYQKLVYDLADWAMWKTAKDAFLVVVHYPEFFYANAERFKSTGWAIHRAVRWCYNSNIGQSNNNFTRSSRDIVFFRKGDPHLSAKADPEPYQNPTDKRVRELIKNGSPGRAPYDWWVFNLQKNVGVDHQGYSNQLPVPLLRRIILSASREGQLVGDPFAGTGSTLKAAESLGRRAWGCDANPGAPVHRPVSL